MQNFDKIFILYKCNIFIILCDPMDLDNTRLRKRHETNDNDARQSSIALYMPFDFFLQYLEGSSL